MSDLTKIRPSIGALTAKDALDVIAMLAKIRLQNLELAAQNAELEAKTAGALGDVKGQIAANDAKAQMYNSWGTMGQGVSGVTGAGVGFGSSNSLKNEIETHDTNIKQYTSWDKHLSEVEAGKASVGARPQNAPEIHVEDLKQVNVLNEKPETHKDLIAAAKSAGGSDAFQVKRDEVRSKLKTAQDDKSHAEQQRAAAINTFQNLFSSGGYGVSGGLGVQASYEKQANQEQELLSAITDYSSATFRSISQAINQLSEGELNQLLGAAETLMGQVAAANKV